MSWAVRSLPTRPHLPGVSNRASNIEGGWKQVRRAPAPGADAAARVDRAAGGLCRGLPLFAQKARVKPPLEPAKRELTTLLKIDPNEYVKPIRNCHS